MSTLTFSQGSKTRITRNIKAGHYLSVTTGFCTEAGPAPGTIWIMAHDKSRECLEVEDRRGRKAGLVYFAGSGVWGLQTFLKLVETGEAILIGVSGVAMDSTAI